MDTTDPKLGMAAPRPWRLDSSGLRMLFTVLVLCAVALLSFADFQLKLLLTEPIKVELKLSDTQIGHLHGLGIAVFTALAAFPLGWLADRFDRRWVLAGCTGVWAVSIALAGLAQSFGALLTAFIVVAVGEATMISIVYALTPQLVPLRRLALANALVYATIVLGGGVLLALGGGLYGYIEAHRADWPGTGLGGSWRFVFFAFAVPAALLAVALLLLPKPGAALAPRGPAAADTAAAHEAHGGFAGFFREHGLAVVLVEFGLSALTIGWMLMAMWMPSILARTHGVGVAQAGVQYGSLTIAASAVGVALGYGLNTWLLKRHGGAPTLQLARYTAGLAALVLLALLSHPGPMGLLAIVGVASALLVTGASQAPTLLQHLAPTRFLARTITLFAIVGLPVRATMPVATGMLSDALAPHTPHALVYATVAGTVSCLLVAFAVLTWAERRYAVLVAMARRDAASGLS